MNTLKKRFSVLGLVWISLLVTNCTQKISSNLNLEKSLSNVESIKGRTEYLNSPYVTAGDRLYMIGHQNGQFPDLGWHVAGEMGGIWDHPIKLIDGFTGTIVINGQSTCLSHAEEFVNYPFANKHAYQSAVKGLSIERFQFVPDGQEAVVVEYTFNNTEATDKTFTFLFDTYTDLRPVWLGERTGMIDGNDEATWDEATNTWIAKDALNPWFVMFGGLNAKKANVTPVCHYQPQGKGCRATLSFTLTVSANSAKTIPITIAGSYQSSQQMKDTYQFVQTNASKLLAEKRLRYEGIDHQTRLTIPDKKLEQAFRWVKYDTDWLIRDVPEIGRGLSAGLPDYPWWFGVDGEYALQGLIATGRKDVVYNAIDLIHKISKKTSDNGKILHEVSTNGAVFNDGNINETPQFASLIYKVYQWTGDKEFLAKYFPTIKKGLDWLMTKNDANGNLFPDGFGMMEIHGMNSEMIDVAVYTQKAFADAAEMAKAMDDNALATMYSAKAQLIRQKINKDFWVADANSFADFIGTKEQALHLIDDAIIRADTLKKPWAVEELNITKNKISALPPNTSQGFVLHHNWVVNTPMEMGIADTDKAIIALNTASKFVSPFGVFVTGIDRDETAGKDEMPTSLNRKIFTYTGAVMTLPTGVLAIAENNYGRPDKALHYLNAMTKSFSFALPGSIYEVSPDYGMVAQAWNLYSYGVPIVQQFFGIQPKASEKTIVIQPQMPSTWNQASLENVKVGDNEIGIHYDNNSNNLTLKIEQSQSDWKLVLTFPTGKYHHFVLNGKVVVPINKGKSDIIESSEKKISLVLN
ncbi:MULTISPECIES: glycogen debranching protein [unclassified Arcicella]|uniref:alpha-L-rhamnosidase-related protein n=1 Tax=unclassified Arcicella TaxID=2644986 RepID=UPI00285CC251|nr:MULTISPECIES: glycogen debranching protein [unclassified Arcicella]MDR6560269.1 glycogen debranching enzyme [Arcicella sp. BE51]MDR6810125.1 glycogen debranching enzyme [Arcicella sp. BE140]MDR6821474.1 glycogen debranching enzyme [Arcicella sp. BE139]